MAMTANADAKALNAPLLPVSAERRSESKETALLNVYTFFKGFAMCFFIVVRSSQALLLQECRGPYGFPFVFQTIMIVPLIMQQCLYSWQAFAELGISVGLKTLLRSWRSMAPAAFYSGFIALGNILQVFSQGLVDASTYIVLMQLVLVFVALGERLILKMPSNKLIWFVIYLQAGCVIYYKLVAVKPHKHKGVGQAPEEDDAGELLGIVTLLLGVMSTALGSILQQKFMQVACDDIPVCVKLFYQHLFCMFVQFGSVMATPSARNQIWENGFFGGWNSTVVLTCFVTWFCYVGASTVTVYISAMAAAMCQAIVVVTVGLFAFFVKGVDMLPVQILLIVMIASNSGMYAFLKERLKSQLHAASESDDGSDDQFAGESSSEEHFGKCHETDLDDGSTMCSTSRGTSRSSFTSLGSFSSSSSLSRLNSTADS